MTVFLPSPRFSSQAVMAAFASAVGRPSSVISSLRELTATPGSASAWVKRRIGLIHARRDHADDRQVERLGELEVALVVTGHGHDRAGAVAHQHVVGDPDRDRLAVDRVDGVSAGEDAGLGLGQVGAVEVALARGGLAVGVDTRSLRRRS